MSDPLRMDRTCEQVDCGLTLPPPLFRGPPLRARADDYQVRDYDAFVRALFDALSARAPAWKGRSEADLSTVLVELLAYAGDQLSYYSDRVALEAYLGTATQLESVRRHLRLIDYELDPGAAATAILAVQVSQPMLLPAGFRVETAASEQRPAVVFETDEARLLHPALNTLTLGAAAPLGGDRRQVQLVGVSLAGPLTTGSRLLLGRGAGAEWARLAAPPVAGLAPNTWIAPLERPLAGTFAPGTMVRGNGVRASHGESQVDTRHGTGSDDQRAVLPLGPLTWLDDADGRAHSTLQVRIAGEPWFEVEDFIDSTADDPHYRVRIGNDGTITVQFGGGGRGRVPPPSRDAAMPDVEITWRTGLGAAGLVAADTLTRVPRPLGGIAAITNPLPSSGAREPEDVRRARLVAPHRARTNERAVVEADFERLTARGVRVDGATIQPLHARAVFRWTGSWTSTEVSLDFADRTPLGARPAVRDAFTALLDQLRIAGSDVLVRDADYAPVHLGIRLIVDDAHVARLVRLAAAAALGTGVLPDGQPALFHPTRFGFGAPLHLSALYAAVQRVDGVRAATVTRFKRLGDRFPDRESDGVITVGAGEIIRCDNDPNHPEMGIVHLETCGGKAG